MLKRVSDCLQSRCCTCCGPDSSVLGGCPVILAPTHEIMAGPDRDSQKCLQTLLNVSGSRRTKSPLINNLCLYHAGIGKERMQTLVLDVHELEDI